LNELGIIKETVEGIQQGIKHARREGRMAITINKKARETTMKKLKAKNENKRTEE
jgi:hypothetical protein